MPRPIVIGYHLTWTAYGQWLPNDPRGSMSHTISYDLIAELGQLHHGRKKVQPAGWVIEEFRQRAKQVLKFQVLKFSFKEVESIALAFADTIREQTYTCYACTIMPDHVHLLIRKHKHQAEEMIENFQEASRLRLCSDGLREPEHPVWGGPGWKVFLDHPDEMRRTIKYIDDNSVKWRLPRQQWSFVKPYDGWPLYPGHSPNSPYAKRLRGES